MCDSVRFHLDDFTNSQIELHKLADHASYDSLVTFKLNTKPYLIPFILNDRIELAQWSGHYRESMLLNGAIHGSEPKLVEIPALSACKNGIWFKVAPFIIRGVIIPGSKIYMLTKPSTNYFLRMTWSDWEPSYNGVNRYHNAIA